MKSISNVSASNVIMKVIGIILITAAVLKGYQLLTEPTAEATIWSQRWFLILQVEFELFLGIWLMSGIMKQAAWLAALSCFVLFSGVTLYKGITGADSCGCFGSVKVNPWVTLLTIDLPAVLGLGIFRPADLAGKRMAQPKRRFLSLPELFSPRPPLPRFVAAISTCLIILAATASILAFNEPERVTFSYEVLEPETWIGKQLPILEYIDIAEQLKTGTWILLLYHYDCPDCAKAIPQYEQMAENLAGNEEFIQIALIEMPPYGNGSISPNSPCIVGQLAAFKEWFVTTPAVTLLEEGKVQMAWEGKAPDFEMILENIVSHRKHEEQFLSVNIL